MQFPLRFPRRFLIALRNARREGDGERRRRHVQATSQNYTMFFPLTYVVLGLRRPTCIHRAYVCVGVYVPSRVSVLLSACTFVCIMQLLVYNGLACVRVCVFMWVRACVCMCACACACVSACMRGCVDASLRAIRWSKPIPYDKVVLPNDIKLCNWSAGGARSKSEDHFAQACVNIITSTIANRWVSLLVHKGQIIRRTIFSDTLNTALFYAHVLITLVLSAELIFIIWASRDELCFAPKLRFLTYYSSAIYH